MAPRDPKIQLASDEDSLTLDRAQRREILRKLERLERVEEEFRRTRYNGSEYRSLWRPRVIP